VEVYGGDGGTQGGMDGAEVGEGEEDVLGCEGGDFDWDGGPGC
jgi:hypothetical protein